MSRLSPVVAFPFIPRQALTIVRTEPNFASFIGRGSKHVITQHDDMYTRKDGNVSFADWLNDVVAGRPVEQNVDCRPNC